jgi:hypothetical protein
VCEAGDVPSAEDCEAAWNRYYSEVAETGEDVLCELSVSPPKQAQEQWTVFLVKSICGWVLRFGRKRGGKRQSPAEVPQYVKDYMLLHERAGKGLWRTKDPDDPSNPITGTCEAYQQACDEDPNARVTLRAVAHRYGMFVTVTVDGPAKEPSKSAVRKAARKRSNKGG